MRKLHVPFIVLFGVALFCGIFTPDSQAGILRSNVVKVQSQWTIDFTEHSTPFTLVKKGGGKGKKLHGAKGGGKRKARPDGVGQGNAGESQVRGLDRADDVAGEHGQRGRAKARKQHGRGHKPEEE